MKVKLRNFPNGAHVVYEHCEFVKCASKLKDHFCLVRADFKAESRVNPPRELGKVFLPGETPMCLYLHRDTYVEPIESDFKF